VRARELRVSVPLVDTHAHLCDPCFDGDRAEVLARARQAGVSDVIAVGESLDDARRNLGLAREHPGVHAAAGLYPTHLDMAEAEAMIEWIRRHAGELVAIGEVGLDRWVVKDDAARELQCGIFERFVALSNELDLPLNVHSRSAGRRAVALLVESAARRVHLHAFDGRPAAALPGVEAGFFFSVPPSIVRSRQKQKLVSRLPLDCLMLETDSPVLGPDRERRNEPASVLVALAAIAEIKRLPVEAVAEAVTANTRRLYALPPVPRPG